MNNSSLKIYYKDDANLLQYTTTKEDIKKGTNRKPEEKSVVTEKKYSNSWKII